MEEEDLLIARFHELSRRSYERNYITSTEFLSLSEQNVFYDLLRKENVPLQKGTYQGSYFACFGGHAESDRKILAFSPNPWTEEGKETFENASLACIRLVPKSIKYADQLTHRDYLGALMHLGYERKNFGDILTDGTTGYLFLLNRVAEDVAGNLQKIKHTPVSCEILHTKECPFTFRFLDKRIFIPHNRLDAIIKEVFDMSRRDSQEKIGKEEVFVDGRTVKDNSQTLKPNARVSVRGKGKFLYVGDEKETKKGRIVVTIRLFC